MKNVKTVPTIEIIIPALNEADNIGQLLSSLANQKLSCGKIVSITTVSDGSTDDTVKIVSKITQTKKLFKLINHTKRKGKGQRLTEFFKKASADVVVVLDADIVIYDRQLISKLIYPIVTGFADLTSSKVSEMPATNWVQTALTTSMELKKWLFEHHKKGQNVYTCHGRSRAFSQKLYQNIRFPVSSTEDAYSYLYCQKNNFRYRYIENATVFYQLPLTISDHLKQSLRFIQSRQILAEKFGATFVQSEYALPVALKIRGVLLFLIVQPIGLLSYFCILFYAKFLSSWVKIDPNVWSVAISSKKIAKDCKYEN